MLTVADAGFPRGGRANPRGGGGSEEWGVGAPTYDFAKFFQKLHEIERIWTPGGRTSLALPLDPPLVKSTSICGSVKLCIERQYEISFITIMLK